MQHEDDDEMIAIFNQNAYDVGGEDNGEGSSPGCAMLALTAAKINHSCEPNAVGNMNWLTNCYTVQGVSFWRV